MYNPYVLYTRPDGATLSATLEITARFGKPARTYEFVTGWKSPDNVSGHNPDSSGITHGVDIFCTPARNRWIADHLAARGASGDRRVLYVIYAGQIANARTGWKFAGSGWDHWDHVHLSVWDGWWGGPCTFPATIYDDRSSWGIAPVTNQEEEMTPEQAQQLKWLAQQLKWLVDNFTAGAAGVKTAGGSYLQLLRIENTAKAQSAELAATKGLVAQLAKGQGVAIDYDRIDAGVAAALAAGIKIEGTITTAGEEE